MTEAEVRRLWSGLVSVRQGDGSQTGFMIGPDTLATATHGLDQTKPIKVCRVGRSPDATDEVATVLLWDTKRDLCLLSVEGSDDYWFVADPRPLAISAEYLVISCVERRVETTVVVNEGLVEDAGIEWLKLKSGQIRRGYSGAPVLDRQDGRLVGMVRVTRGRQTDLGGHALVGKEISDVRAVLGLDRDDRRMQVRHATTGPSWLQQGSMRGNPPTHQVNLLGREAEIAELDSSSGPRHRLVVGPEMAGKSALTGVWARLPHLLAGDTAYVDAADGPPASATHPVVGIILPVLGTTIPQDPFGSRSDEEILALACWTVMRDLRGGRLVVDLQQETVDSAAYADLAAMVTAADQMNVGVIVVGRAFDQGTALMRSSVVVQVGPLGLTVAADLVERTTLGRVSREDARSALELVEASCLLPGQIVTAACSEGNDAVDIAVELERHSSLLVQKQDEATGRAPLPALKGVGDVSRDDDWETNEEVAAAALERHVLLSARNPLGVRLPAPLRELLRHESFPGDAVRLDVWTGTQPFVLSVDALTREQGLALQHIAHRVSGRSLRSAWVGALHQQIVELEQRHAEQPPSIRRQVALLRSQIQAGNVFAARRTFSSAGGVQALEDIIQEAPHLAQVEDIHILVLGWWLGVGPDEALGEAIGEWIRRFAADEQLARRTDAKVVLHDLLRALVVRALPSPEGLRVIAEWCLSQVEDDRAFLSDPGAWTMFISLIGRAGDLSGDASLTTSFLPSALDALWPHLPLLRSLAIAGDSRPLLTIARQERRLHRLGRSQRGGGRGRLRLAHDLLTWTTEKAPTADAFLTLLAMDRSLNATQVGGAVLDSGLPTHRSAASRIAQVKRAYRSWWKKHPRIDETTREIEYRIVKAEWATEGSLLRMAAESDNRWVFRPIPHKVMILSKLDQTRRKRLASIVNRFGESVDAVEMDTLSELQFQTALAIVQREPIDYRPVDEILKLGADAFASDARMMFLIAAHRRQRRDFVVAGSHFVDAFGLALCDPLLRLRSAVSACESLSQSYAAGQCDREVLVTAMERAKTFEETDASASIVCTLARLELYGTLSEAYRELAGAIAEVGSFTALATRMDIVGADMSEAAEPGQASLLSRFLDDFTEAGLLVAVGSMFIRSHQLSPSEQTDRLRAALVLLDGVRVMAGTVWNAPSVNFHQGRALLYACRQAQDPNPIGWDLDQDRRDVDLACAKFQSAADLAVGSFREVALAHLREAVGLRSQLPRQLG